jgi:DNA-binding transcriptional regulator YhcF (GntR family)
VSQDGEKYQVAHLTDAELKAGIAHCQAGAFGGLRNEETEHAGDFYIPGGFAPEPLGDDAADEEPGLAPPPDPRLWVRIADDIRQAIAAGRLSAGDPVTIFPIAERWDTCRQTASKALRTLEHEGLLARYPGHGYIVPRHFHPCENKDRIMTEQAATAEAIAQHVVKQLEPVLAEMNQKLDAITALADAMLDALQRMSGEPRPPT